MNLDSAIPGLIILHVVLLAAFGGWVIVSRAPEILREPLVAGSAFLNGIVVVAGLFVLLNAVTLVEQAAGFLAVLLGAAAAAGALAVLSRRLAVFRAEAPKANPDRDPAVPNVPVRRRNGQRAQTKVARVRKARSIPS
jgi:NAD(P) transhydrogenase subunit alpha